jgi:hypothetical protein
MTLFSSNLKCTAIVVGGDIVYENGATVKTSFLSNMFGNIRILGAPELYNDLKATNPQVLQDAEKLNTLNSAVTKTPTTNNDILTTITQKLMSMFT